MSLPMRNDEDMPRVAPIVAVMRIMPDSRIQKFFTGHDAIQ